MKRVLCYGDSLTAGYHSQPKGYSPYGQHLLSASVAVDIIGLSGFTTKNMLDSVNYQENEDCFEQITKGLCVQCREHEYDAICLLAGTNDIGEGENSSRIIHNIDALVQLCLEHTFRVFLCTIPAMGAEAAEPELTNVRNEVNEGIVEITKANSDQVVIIDSSALLPQAELIGLCGERSCTGTPIWDADGLHLSPQGSKVLGEHIKQVISTFTVI